MKLPFTANILKIATRPWPAKWVNCILILSFAALSAVVLHHFFSLVGKSPYLATDDALANVSFNFAEWGRYGFPASPLQGGTMAIRTYAFFNFGPWYFLAGGALAWLFGPVFEIQRAIHPFGILVICVLAIVVFRRSCIAAAGIFAAALLWLFVFAHWPMARPDIMVSVLAMAGIAASGVAIRTRQPAWWVLSAFMIAAAISQHQISWALGPGLIVIWLVASILNFQREVNPGTDSRGRWPDREYRIAFIAAGVGAIAATVIYLIFIDFRISALVDHFSYYSKVRAASGDHGGYLNVLAKHYAVAFSPFPRELFRFAAAGFGLAAILNLVCPFFGFALRRKVFAIVGPPVLIGGAYLLGLGVYGNWHAGYAILSQVSALWAAAAGIAALMVIIHSFWPRGAIRIDRILTLFVAALILWETQLLSEKSEAIQANAATMVNIDDYTNLVAAPMPPRARTWGTVQFGYKSSLRTDYLQLGEGILLASYFKPEVRESIAPDFIVLGYRELNDSFAGTVENAKALTQFKQLAQLFPGSRFELMHMVKAPPYGTTRIYNRVPRAFERQTVVPSVNVNDGTSRQWGARLMPAVLPVMAHPRNVTFDLPFYGRRVQGTSKRAQQILLGKGVYLIEVVVNRKSRKGSGVLAATHGDRVIGNPNETGYGFEIAPYFFDERKVFLLVRNDGAPVYISQFDEDPEAGFLISSISPVEIIPVRTEKRKLPPLDQWRLLSAKGKIKSVTTGSIKVAGDNVPWGMQLGSPPIAVPKKTNIALSLPLEITGGNVAIGVLDSRGYWYLPPRSNLRKLVFNTGPWDTLTIVVANIGTPPPTEAAVFSLRTGLLEIDLSSRSRTYSDDLLRCHRDRRGDHSDICR